MTMATLGLEPLRVLCKDAKLVPCQFLVGGTGAVGTILRTGFGTAKVGTVQGTVVRDSAGQYTITLPGEGGYFAIIPVGEPTATGTTAAVVGRVEAITESTGTVQIQFLNSSGVATDPDSGAKVSLVLLVSDFPHIDPDDDA